MPARTNRAPVITLAFLAPLALLTACGSSGGGTGGNGAGGGGNGGGSATTSSGTGTTTTTQGPGCMEICSALSTCPNVPASDCAKDCPPVEKWVDDGMCRDLYTAYVSCTTASQDPCQASNNDCADSFSEFVACTSAYCQTHTTEPLCE